MRFAGKVVAVTGGGSGLGRAAVELAVRVRRCFRQ
jgi:NAD(P)-dependent dehydrogenase (short-subunit alcohol dehydrogenase family)